MPRFARRRAGAIVAAMARATRFTLLVVLASAVALPRALRAQETRPAESLPSDAAGLVALLGHPEWRARERAFQALAAMDETAWPVVAAAAASGDGETRCRAALLLHRIPRPELMVLVAAGEFVTGPPDSPVRGTTKAFWIDRYEVSIHQYGKFLAATGYRKPRHWPELRGAGISVNAPIFGVDVEDARRYAAWAGRRLPSEAEWEKAARGTDGRLFAWGNEPLANAAMVDGDHAPEPGGAFPRDLSPFGCFDMTGNVREWVAPLRPRGPAFTKGGSYVSGIAHAELYRRFPGDDRFTMYTGFRCVRDAAPGDVGPRSAGPGPAGAERSPESREGRNGLRGGP